LEGLEPIRRRPDNHGLPLESYRERFKTFPDSIEATGEDSVIALYRMTSGAMVQFSYVAGGRGGHTFERSVHGRKGSMVAPGDRNGRQVVLKLDGRELRGKDILALLPKFQLTEITERLFGANVVEYEFPDPYDAIVAFEMFEHIPYEQFQAVLARAAASARTFVFLSVPRNRKTAARLEIKLPKLKGWTAELKVRKGGIDEPYHVWEVDHGGISVSSLEADLEKVAPIERRHEAFDRLFYALATDRVRKEN